MSLLLISAIPLFIIILFGSRLSNRINLWLGALSIPFFIQLAFYGTILLVGILLTLAVILKIRHWQAKRAYKKQPVEVLYHTRR